MRVLVEDPSQSAVSGAKVSLQNSGAGIAMESTSDGEGYALFSPVKRGLRDGKENTQKFDVKGDYSLNDKNQISARYSYLRQKFNRDAIFPGLGDGDGNQGAQFNENNSLAINWTRTIGTRMVNNFRYGRNGTFAEFAHATANGEKADAFGFRGIPADLPQVGGLPQIDVNNYNDPGTRNFRPQFRKPLLNQFIETFSLTSGRHFVRAGFEVRLKDNTFIDVTRRTPSYGVPGVFTGDSIGDLLLGLPDTGRQPRALEH